MANFIKRPKPVVLIVLDGVGVAKPGPGNAVTLAETPNLDKFWSKYPHSYLEASGLHVGLPAGSDGNSEVGHMCMGAGKVIFQDLPRIDNAIQNESFYENPVLKAAMDHTRNNQSNLHLMGLLGNGIVHSSFEHLIALIEMAKRENVNPDKVFIHAFTDGRDSAPDAGIALIEKAQAYCIQKRLGRVVSIVGRAYAMDRDRRWDKTQKAYELLTSGKGQVVKNWQKEMKSYYDKKILDEYMEPLCITYGGEEPVKIQENDAVIFFNFRPDRAVQLTKAFEEDKFEGFPRQKINNLYFVGMTDYEEGFPNNKAFPPEHITHPLGKVLAEQGLNQLRITESEKFPHVTYFFNGGNPEVNPGEKWMEVPSPKDVATYDKKPEMSMRWVTDILVEKIEKEDYDFILVNYAGPDMVGHTGVMDATITAMNIADECIGRVIEAVLKKKGAVLVTADHGNAEEIINLQNGEPDTKHSVNQVPIIIIDDRLSTTEFPIGGLADVAPTILGLMGLEIPAEMTGRDLLSNV